MFKSNENLKTIWFAWMWH